ncbi:MAG: hypothetical protein D6806_12455 [Deltaproteobacteria bacterium]|nr:MAG: hypothetical protein D6806_12455 [Deltaproteobacteria bacterium]
MFSIGVVVNSRAGRKRLRPAIWQRRLERKLGAGDRLWRTTSTGDLRAVIAEFLSAGLDVLAIAGGDGSNHLVLSELIRQAEGRKLPAVAMQCGGTHNAHAASLGIRGRPDVLLERILKLRSTGRLPVTRRIVLRVQDGKRTHHGFSMAAGFMYRFYEALLGRGSDSTLKVATTLARWAGSALFDGTTLDGVFCPCAERLWLDGERIDFEGVNGVACSAVERLGMGVRAFPLAGRYADRFHVIATRATPRKLLQMVPSLWIGRAPRDGDLLSDTAAGIRLEHDSQIGYVLDGELYEGSRELSISAGPVFSFIKV